jgi:class 3 adenylate cyclase/predicted ATPase
VVSVLFVDLVGFTRIAEGLDPEDLRRVQDRYFESVRSEITSFGGHVEKYIGDAVMALFGAPVAYGDDPERAVLAAFGIRQAMEQLNAHDPRLDLEVRIGVSTGVAFVDLDADRGAGEGMASGDVVVTAFRLQHAAPPGGILVGEATYRATRRTIEYAEQEPVTAKGKPVPVRAWAAAGPRESAGRPGARLVGRSAELSYLGSLVDPEGAGLRMATLVGPPGMGKSRLVWELSRLVEDDSPTTIWRQGRCLSYGTGVSFSAFAQIVKAQADILESDTAETVGRKLSAAVAAAVDDPAARVWIEAYLRPLVGLEGVERLSGDRRGEAFAAWRRFVEGLATSGRVVLAFEDMHWGDDGLLDFVEHLGRFAADRPLTIVCTARPELRDRRPGWAGIVELEPLSDEDTIELVGELMGRSEMPPDVRSDLVGRAAGNALYAEEFVRMLQERPAGASIALPETVQALIAARLDALHPEAKEVLRDAAVVGTGFWVGALAHVSGLRTEQVERRLGELQFRELVRPQPRSAVADESQYAFWHVLVRDVAYAQIPRAARVDKHRAAAEWIESLAPGRGDLTELLAHHYTSALEYAGLTRQATGDLAGRARLALRDAGEHALGVYAYGAAARFFRGALELWPEDAPARPQLLFELGKSLFWSERDGGGELAESRDALVAAGDTGRAAQADILLTRLSYARADREAAGVHAANAVELLRGSAPSAEQAKAISNLAAFHSLDGDTDRALEAIGEALALAESLGLDEVRAEALTFRGHARMVAGDDSGIEDLDQAVEVAEGLRSPVLVRSCANLATVLVGLGQLDRAWAVYDRGREAAERLGDAVGLHWLAAERPYEHYWRGNWDEALALVESSLQEPDGGWVDHACHSIRAWIRLARGDEAGALEDASNALEFARGAKESASLCQGLALKARVLAETGRPDEAAPLADEALAQAATPGVLQSFWWADLADALHDLGRLDAPGRRTASRWVSAARLLAASEYPDAADEYAAIGARPEEARTRLRAAVALAAEGRRQDADAELERARAFYEEVGAGEYVDAAEARLAARTEF